MAAPSTSTPPPHAGGPPLDGGTSAAVDATAAAATMEEKHIERSAEEKPAITASVPTTGSADDGDKHGDTNESTALRTRLGAMFTHWTPKRRPAGLKWRSASWFITSVVAVGVTMDVLAYVSVPLSPRAKQHLRDHPHLDNH